jgi:folylpolyglutamate synthase
VQRINASLAIALVQEYLTYLNLETPLEITSTTVSPEIITALENTRLTGRCETRVENDITWYCDVAHTGESVAIATQWYNSM